MIFFFSVCCLHYHRFLSASSFFSFETYIFAFLRQLTSIGIFSVFHYALFAAITPPPLLPVYSSPFFFTPFAVAVAHFTKCCLII